MIAVLQRVTRASVRIEGQITGHIGLGLVALVAVERGDGEAQVRWMASKLPGLRVFPDEPGAKAYDRDVRQVGGGILLISNFTVAASCQEGRRPSLENAAPPAEAQRLFDALAHLLREQGVPLQLGRFGAMMQIELVNDGPVTFLLQSPP